ncbi:HD domain-containing protein 2 homolog [Pistacia vera]|uniref:HD domain-containing protein 2 homolog n=1 Tax=Pistacia vera TaxID=55513 RepID=UPI0012631847|nr:HD domain-containing protein 2 homolog [Pistacia vera]
MNSHTKMAVNSSTHCALPLNRPLLRRVPPAFFIRTSTRPIFSNGAPKPRLVSVRASNDGFGSKNSVNLKNSEAQVGVSSSSTSSAVDFLTLCNRLKTTKRKGWINHGIKGPESIADHMYRMALMALIAGDIPGVDRERCIKIAIVHDIAEAIVGDITPSDNVPKEVKSRMEQAALDEMCKVLGGGMRAEEIRELWAEYENNASIEANLVKDFDKVEMILQALEYEIEHGKVLDEFFLSTAGKFQTEIGKKWAAEINHRRNSRLANKLE